jgi:pilus assembly protein Flp/PilA
MFCSGVKPPGRVGVFGVPVRQNARKIRAKVPFCSQVYASRFTASLSAPDNLRPRQVTECVMLKQIVAFAKNESGATAIEYGLIAAGISVAIIAVVNGLGTKMNTKFTSISTQLK